MAITKRMTLLDIKVELDGRVIIYERMEHWEGGFSNGYLDATGPRTGRVIDLGDDVSGEDVLIQDLINGTIHTPARIANREAEKLEDFYSIV